MAQDIVGSLFGPNPAQIQQDYITQESNRANQYANLNPFQQANYGAMVAGQMGGRAISGLLGAEDPRLQQAKQMEQVKQWISQSGVDINTPEGLAQAAQYAQSIGATEGAMFLGQQSQKMKQTQVETRRTEALATREESRNAKLDRMESELQSLPPDATQEQILAIVTKYGDANTIIRELNDRAEKQAKLQAEGGINASGNPGSVGKAGAYRDVNGQIWGVTEMKDYRQEYETAQKMMDDLNKITPEDVSNAQSRFVEPSSSKFTKQVIGNEKMTSAQSKLAATKLLQQIANLPKGSASDKDMETAKENFPGWHDAVALAKWVNETKRTLQDRITKMSDQFGWKPKTTSTGYVDVDGTGRSLEGFVINEEGQQPTAPKVRKWNPQTQRIE